jgi:hypothetical protein
MLITEQVATAPCTDCVQVERPTFEAKRRRIYLREIRASLRKIRASERVFFLR